ncbi:unnamed protein product [Timema podura]|uniref:Uncharacterized protein n=1 Tax=Timema podura TaxID=61482 RepID=A0ABN7NKJ9_TIMPD|nr:unnamed protein product [Timema podura]
MNVSWRMAHLSGLTERELMSTKLAEISSANSSISNMSLLKWKAMDVKPDENHIKSLEFSILHEKFLDYNLKELDEALVATLQDTILDMKAMIESQMNNSTQRSAPKEAVHPEWGGAPCGDTPINTSGGCRGSMRGSRECGRSCRPRIVRNRGEKGEKNTDTVWHKLTYPKHGLIVVIHNHNYHHKLSRVSEIVAET